MTLEGMFITIIIAILITTVTSLVGTIKRLNEQSEVLKELGLLIHRMAIGMKQLSDHDMKLLDKLEQQSSEFIRKDEAN